MGLFDRFAPYIRAHDAIKADGNDPFGVRMDRVLSPTEALHSLRSDAFDFTAGGQAVFEILTDLVSTVPVYRLGYGRLDEAVRAVDELLG